MDTWTHGHSRLAAVALQLLPGIVLPLIGTAGHAGKGKKWVWWQIFKNHLIQPFLLMDWKSTTCCIIYSIMSSAGISSGLHLALTSGQGLTGSCSFTHKGHQLLFNLLEGVQVIHKEDVPVTGLTGDAHQLPVVSISEANGKHDVTFDGNSERERSMSPSTGKLEEQYERRLLHILKADKVWPSSNTDRSSRPSSELHIETTDLPSASLWRLCWRHPEIDRQWAPRGLWGFLSSLPPLLWRCFSSRAGWLDLSEQTEQPSPITPNILLLQQFFSFVFSVVEKQQQTSYLKQHVYNQRIFYYADLTSHHLFWLKKSLAELQVCHCGLGSDGKSKLINFQLQSPVWQTLFWEEVRKSCNTIDFRGSPFTVLSIKNMKERKLKGLYKL